jgi:hypothetical protein
VLERTDAIETAVRGRLLEVFDAQDGHLADGQRTTRTWLVNSLRVTKGQAGEYQAVQALARGHRVLYAALSAPQGGGDLRTRPQRYHDALAEAMRRLLASDLLPQRAGQPVKALVHIYFAELRDRDQDGILQDKWIAEYRARWAAHRAAASVSTGDGGAWLEGDTAREVAPSPPPNPNPSPPPSPPPPSRPAWPAPRPATPRPRPRPPRWPSWSTRS